MKPPFQQQQQRMQRDRMRGAAWQEQQKPKKGKKDRAQVPGIAVGNKFNQVEAEVEKLKRALTAGKLTGTQFEERLNSLMFQDSSGIWWMVGAETGGWYYYDGSNWMPGVQLPGQTSAQPISSKMSSGTQSASFMKRLSVKIEAIFIFSSGMIFVGIFGFIAGEITSEWENFLLPFLVTGVIWIGGSIIVFREARKKWRRA